MKNYFAISFLFLTFAMQKYNDCPFQTEKQSKITYSRESNKEIAHVRNGVSPLASFRNFGYVVFLRPDVGVILSCSNFYLKGKMQKHSEKKGFERGEVSPPQAAALSQYLQFVARELPETIALFDELFVAYLGSDFCTSQSENERSNTGFHFFKLRHFLQTLSVVADPANGLQQKGEQPV